MNYGATGYKVFKRRVQGFWLKINCSQMKLLNFENWSKGKLSKSAKMRLKKSIFYVKNHRKLDFFFIEEYELRSTFFHNINF